jgi:hypothetical protein
MARQIIRVHLARKFRLYYGTQDERCTSVRESHEETNIFFDVFPENGQDRIENVRLRASKPGQCGLHDKADSIQFLI